MAQNRDGIFVRKVDLSGLLMYLRKKNLGRQRVKPSLTPIYHPQANLVERKNRDFKPKLAMLVVMTIQLGVKNYQSSDLP